MMVFYILFIQEIKDILVILNSMESPRLRDTLNRSTCKIEKTRTDPAGSKLPVTEPNSGIFLFFRKSDEATASLCLNGSYGPGM